MGDGVGVRGTGGVGEAAGVGVGVAAGVRVADAPGVVVGDATGDSRLAGVRDALGTTGLPVGVMTINGCTVGAGVGSGAAMVTVTPVGFRPITRVPAGAVTTGVM